MELEIVPTTLWLRQIPVKAKYQVGGWPEHHFGGAGKLDADDLRQARSAAEHDDSARSRRRPDPTTPSAHRSSSWAVGAEHQRVDEGNAPSCTWTTSDIPRFDTRWRMPLLASRRRRSGRHAWPRPELEAFQAGLLDAHVARHRIALHAADFDIQGTVDDERAGTTGLTGSRISAPASARDRHRADRREAEDERGSARVDPGARPAQGRTEVGVAAPGERSARAPEASTGLILHRCSGEDACRKRHPGRKLQGKRLRQRRTPVLPDVGASERCNEGCATSGFPPHPVCFVLASR